MVADIRFVRELKIRLSKLNLLCDREIYESILLSFIKANEGERLYVYLDIKKNHTIGIGFNMDTSYAEKIWYKIFGSSISFQQVKEGEKSITKEQSQLLFNYIKANNRLELQTIYKEIWSKLKANEQVMIEDMYWNGGNKLVGIKTNFYQNMILYGTSLELKYLMIALLEVRKNSNPEGNRGIQNRRNIQAEMGEPL
ncbi:hypothetical protein [Rickettsia endosymbiont of Halotydeus destructor]|uniref:hypothetical protein n=1 Tax=Rickettsia endosymbiont of Halotydeus destructor TaxID=2996754 RepID=UPI003BB05657